MFPLEFPLHVLKASSKADEVVFDPFCGRGTTLYAARARGLEAFGIDVNPVAVAISQGKLANTTSVAILDAAREIMQSSERVDVPKGEFWSLAYDPVVLKSVCKLRASLIKDCRSHARKALRAILLGALHGPTGKLTQSYFSNQMPRTYASKPKYAVSFWKKHGLKPQFVDVLKIVELRAQRYFDTETNSAAGKVFCGDSRQPSSLTKLVGGERITCTITSPPYYGMRTYLPDQWLRNWFIGGPPAVEYQAPHQLSHRSPAAFAQDLQKVWENVRAASADQSRLVIRFGGINDRVCDPRELVRESLRESGWRIRTIKPAGSAGHGRRQATAFQNTTHPPIDEIDVWCETA